MTAIGLPEFLQAMYSRVPGHLELRALPSRARTFCGPLGGEAIARFANQHNGEGVYFGVATRRDKTGGTLADCLYVPALWTDIDFKAMPETEARQRLARCPIPASITMASGGGLHAYWLLKEPEDLATGLEHVEGLLCGLAAYLGGDAACAEAARVLRLPETFNHKYTPARAVTIETFEPDRRYTLSDFDWLPAVPQASTRSGGTFSVEGDIREGQRNGTLYRLARSLKAKDIPATSILATLHSVNEQQCRPPLSAREVAAIGGSAIGQANRPDFAPGNGASAVLRRLSTIIPVAVGWLWSGHLARGKYTLLAGDPGVGKSTIALDCAARLSRPGATWPDGTPAPHGSTLLLTAEDGLADTVRPRVDRFGGDADKIIVLEAVRDRGGQRPLDLARDVAILIGAIRDVQPALLVIDPLSAYIGGTDAHRDAEVRGLLAPLVAALDEHDAALLAIAHLNKDQTRSALHRPGGSVAFVAAARLAFAVAADPQDADRRVMACLKSNLCRHPDPLAFRFEGDRLVWEDGPAVGMNAETLLRSVGPADRESQTDAERVIRDLLADESAWPVDARQALDAGRACGVSERTMQRAAKRLHVGIRRTGFGRSGRWLWHRPPIDDTGGAYDPAVSSMAPMREPEGKAPIDAIDDKKSVRYGSDAYERV